MTRWLAPALLILALGGCASLPAPRGDPAANVREASEALLGARLAIAQGDHTRALTLLGEDPGQLPPALRAEGWDLRAQALLGLGDRPAAAAALAARAGYETGVTQADSLREAERQLRGLSDPALRGLASFIAAQDPLLPLLRRELRRRGLELALPQPPAVAATDPVQAGIAPDPAPVAVLLPLSGPLAAAGMAVRNGLLAGYFAETRPRPALAFHDTGGTIEGALQALEQALAAGSRQMIGPLGREEVVALAPQIPPGLAWIALNRLALASPGGASFALAPEEEGAAVADRLIEQGLTRIVALHEADDTALRSLAGLRERFARSGGQVLAHAVLDAHGGNADLALTRLSGPAAAAQALFVAARAPALRVFMPQRDGSGLAHLPVFATSLVQVGADPRLDREFDGLHYPELPWLLGREAGPIEAEALGRLLPSARGGALRLFAFGHDAWTLAAGLDDLHSGALLRGATGELGLDAVGVVERRPSWARYQGGHVQPAADGALLTLPPTLAQPRP